MRELEARAEFRFEATRSSGPVSALLLRPAAARWLLVLAHGAGAGMRHPFMDAVAHGLAACGIATLRYQFPYMEHGRGRPDPPPFLTATVRSAVAAAARAAPELPLLAGGKSLGGRMTSHAAAAAPLPGVRGLVFFGFPLHAAGKPSAGRGDHLARVQVPMLFLQGTRDALADLAFVRPLCVELGARATLHETEDADHSFHVPKRSGRTDPEVLEELARTVSDWADSLVSRGALA